MATIAPTRAKLGDAESVTWAGVSTADTMTAYPLSGLGRGAQRAMVVVSGTFGSSTVTLLGSIDGTNYAVLKDLGGNAISLTAAGSFEFSTCALYLKPASSGGTADNVDVVVCMR